MYIILQKNTTKYDANYHSATTICTIPIQNSVLVSVTTRTVRAIEALSHQERIQSCLDKGVK